ncbi:LOW QUALITY PROTEIN: Cytochrome P450 monooxygenase [Drechslerella dactyloides]|uniref:Cytochrome P450 monooxygenase n=1 Tax=Drechslerella dactyloides TaxID=74499 RepID=A0AAD6NF68_DREDA|nr:LOW QUALITY PROTEIN: Cytochrome P450 monooxygenase [Drechslerella dactyloides]
MSTSTTVSRQVELHQHTAAVRDAAENTHQYDATISTTPRTDRLERRWLHAMSLIITLLVVAPLLAVLQLLYTRYKPHLRRVPGPFIASFTNAWRLNANLGRRPEVIHINLHREYGDLVRIGPNCVSVGAATEVKQIYGITRLFQKCLSTTDEGFTQSKFYPVTRPVANGKPVLGVFDTDSEDLHKILKRPIGHTYAMSTLLDYEPYVDGTLRVLQARLEELYVDKGVICDLGEWVHWAAFDVIGEMTFSRRLGFLEQGRDVGDVIKATQMQLDYLAVIGQMPFLDKLLMKNPLYIWWKGNPTSPVTKFALDCMQQRLQEREKGEGANRRDFLAKFLDAADKYEGKIPLAQVVGWTQANVFAGSDTTHPNVMDKLRAELTAALQPTTTAIPPYSITNALPYLSAVIKESLRLHPAVGILLERLVPNGGATISGQFLPAGTIVGCNPWVVHRDTRVYGADADEFRPERWLEATDEQRAAMERADLVFGSGKRTCIGRNISLLEVHKLVPWMVLRYDIQLAHPGQELKIHNSWFVGQTGLEVYLKRREVS